MRGSSLVLVIVLTAFAVFVYGVMQLGWDFDQMSAMFFAMGVLAGLAGGLGLGGTARGFVNGFSAMAYAAMLIGFARAIFVVLDQGRVIDTIVNALVAPLQNLPVALSALGMMVVQAAVHGPVPSVSGQAVLTLPVLVADVGPDRTVTPGRRARVSIRRGPDRARHADQRRADGRDRRRRREVQRLAAGS